MCHFEVNHSQAEGIWFSADVSFTYLCVVLFYGIVNWLQSDICYRLVISPNTIFIPLSMFCLKWLKSSVKISERRKEDFGCWCPPKRTHALVHLIFIWHASTQWYKLHYSDISILQYCCLLRVFIGGNRLTCCEENIGLFFLSVPPHYSLTT